MSDISAVVRNAVAWTPFAASFLIPFDVIDGAWLAAAARVIILLATWVVCYLICTWHLRMARSSSGGASAKSGARKRHSDMFRFIPNSVSGAVGARLALYLRRDIRQIPVLAIPVVLMAFAVTRATESPDKVWLRSFPVWRCIRWLRLTVRSHPRRAEAFCGLCSLLPRSSSLW